MISFIKVINRMAISHMVVHDYIPYGSWYLISIYADNGKGEFLVRGIPDRVREMGCKDFLSLNFYDATDKENLSEDDKKKLFSRKQAGEIIEFIDRANKEDCDDVLVVHCDAGISRSGAVGEFLNDYLRLNYWTFLRVNPQVNSNKYVLRLLKEESQIGVNKDNSMFNSPA
jgi:hypothetical protein